MARECDEREVLADSSGLAQSAAERAQDRRNLIISRSAAGGEFLSPFAGFDRGHVD